uniref:Uncharacterized protein n=1 Tax=Manihot esculenta TaxID=3983 RepID=A0A2C9W6D9_MANES
MADRRAKGLCYNYDELYSSGHQCKKLFWLESNDTHVAPEEEGFEDNLAISLHAIIDMQNPKNMHKSRTMQLIAKL